MPRLRHLILFASLVALQPALSACSGFDLDKFDVFGLNEKKKLPGDRRALFPEGIPGVAQGVPPDLVKGYQPPPGVQVVEPEPPKPAPRRVARPTRVTVQPAAPQQNSQRQADQPPQQSQQAAPSQSPWPDAPRTGTFSR